MVSNIQCDAYQEKRFVFPPFFSLLAELLAGGQFLMILILFGVWY
jgi:hypothetical protein